MVLLLCFLFLFKDNLKTKKWKEEAKERVDDYIINSCNYSVRAHTLFVPRFPYSVLGFILYLQYLAGCRDSDPSCCDRGQICYQWATRIPIRAGSISFASDVLKVRSSLFRYIRSLKKSDSLQSLFFKEWIERKKREVWSSWDDVVWVTWSEWRHWLVYKAGSRDHTVAATGPWHYVYIFVFHFFGNFI